MIHLHKKFCIGKTVININCNYDQVFDMYGWNGKILKINLTNKTFRVKKYDLNFAKMYLGGRGFAVKLLWDSLEKGIDPLSEKNKLIFAAGPITGLPLPSAGKLVVAAKSPLTGGYGDGNIGTIAAVNLRKAGYDVIILDGKAETPCYIYINDDNVEFLDASGLWGKDTFESQDILEEKHGKNAGILLIGPAGEKMIKISTIISQKGRAGGRPGMGAVMGSKNVKAVIIKGTRDISVYDEEKLREMGLEGYKEIKNKKLYDFWISQGTMQALQWTNENSCLPTHNYQEGIFEFAENLDGYAVAKAKVERRGCPLCNMRCGNTILDSEGVKSELDYENVGMLGSNLGIGNLKEVATLNRMADELGFDTISLGSVIGFVMELSEKGMISERIEFGDFKKAKNLVMKILNREDIGKDLAEGVRYTSEKYGGKEFAMHVKGLEISAYNCHACPGMALAFGTSPIGAHHKDSWVISWEISTDRYSYSKEKVEKVIELQRIRGGMFESLTACRLPWVEVGFDLSWYPKYLSVATGETFTMYDMNKIADRIYALMRAFWIRENGEWDRYKDYPPERWFSHPLTKGNLKGQKLEKEKYDEILSMYYELRGWDENGVPKKETLEKLGLKDVIKKIF